MTDEFPMTLDANRHRDAMAAHLRRMADALDAGAPVVSGGLVATDALSLSGDLVLGEAPANAVTIPPRKRHAMVLRAMRAEGSMMGVPAELHALDAAIAALLSEHGGGGEAEPFHVVLVNSDGRPTPSEPADELRRLADAIDPRTGTLSCAETARQLRAMADRLPPSAPAGDKLLRDLRMIAEQGEMPDGDGVPVNVRLWAEKHAAALTPRGGGGGTCGECLRLGEFCDKHATAAVELATVMLADDDLDQACIRRARELGDHWEHMGPVARDRLRRIVLEEQAAAGFGVVR